LTPDEEGPLVPHRHGPAQTRELPAEVTGPNPPIRLRGLHALNDVRLGFVLRVIRVEQRWARVGWLRLFGLKATC
jgi:hypothetical protein